MTPATAEQALTSATTPVLAEQAPMRATPETAERAPTLVASRAPSKDDLKARIRYLECRVQQLELQWSTPLRI